MKQIALVLLIGLALSLCNLSEKLHGKKSSGSGSSSSGSVSDNGAQPEHAQPTAAQTAALAGGQNARWDRQGLSFTVPAGWTEAQQEAQNFMWRSPGGGGAASLIVSISPLSDEFPMDIQPFFDGAKTRAKNGEVDELKWVEIDGLKGVQFRESAPEHADSPRRLQWMAYRKYTGQVQLVNVMLASDGKDFERHKDAMYGILYSLKITH
jgi:hypothetical protein